MKNPKLNIRIYGLANMFYMKFYLMLEILESWHYRVFNKAGEAASFKDGNVKSFQQDLPLKHNM